MPFEWEALFSCPNCSQNINMNISDASQGRCSVCACDWEWEKNILTWGNQSIPARIPRWKNLLKKIKNQFNPLCSFLLPFRYISAMSTKKYYYRTLVDKALAQKWYDHYVKDLNLQSSDIILDLGCGRGRITALANQMGFNTVGQDIQKSDWWKKIDKSLFQTVPTHCTKLPWRDNTFSAVLSFGVLHYLDEKNLQNHLHNILKVLKPGGACLLLEANSEGYAAHLPHKHCGHLHPLQTVRHICQTLGFQELSVTYEGFYAPIFPLFINFFRHYFSCKSFDISDFDSRLETMTPPEKRALWLMKLLKPL